MHHDYNYSSAIDVATVSWNAMRSHSVFCQVVNTKKYECMSRSTGHTYKWVNTNNMLWDSSRQYFGIKTGVT
jgi:D-alanyl-D-alanine carboxypeptidase